MAELISERDARRRLPYAFGSVKAAFRHADVALTVMATAWLAWSIARFPGWTVDDAFIVLRYADNLVAHGELAFNAGAGAVDRVEGFTSPLAMLVAIVARAAGADAIAATKLVCIGAALAGPALVAVFARTVRAFPLAGGGAALLFVALPEHAIHARSGLETELFVTSVLGLLVAFARLLSQRARPGLFVALALATTLARPEGVSLVLVLALGVLAVRPRADRRALARTFALGIALPLVALTIARLAYYGSPLPNTFYAKRGTWNASHATDLAALFDLVVVDVAAIAAGLWLLAWIARRRPVHLLAPRLRIAALAAVVALAVQTFAYARTEPIMDYGRRFAWHGAALVAVVLVVALEIIVRTGRSLLARNAAIPSFVVIGMVTIASVLRAAPSAQREESWAQRQADSVEPLQEPLIAWIKEQTAPDALIAVYPDAGRLPYLTGRKTIDFGKLNDRVLARAGSDDDVIRYFFERRPEVIVMGRMASGHLWDSAADALVADERFASQYTLARRLPDVLDPNGQGYDIYRRVH